MNPFPRWLIATTVLTALAAAILYLAGNTFVRELQEEVVVAGNRTRESGAGAPTQAGTPAPPFALPSLEGQSLALDDFSGQPLVIVFWTTWHQEAADQLRILEQVLAKPVGRAVAFLTINSQEGRERVLAFAGRGGYAIPILLDTSGAVGERYRLRAVPTWYFIDRSGLISDIAVGPHSASAIVEKAERLIR